MAVSGRFATAEACAGVNSVVPMSLFYPKEDRINSFRQIRCYAAMGPGANTFGARWAALSPGFRYGENSGDSMHAEPHLHTSCHYQILWLNHLFSEVRLKRKDFQEVARLSWAHDTRLQQLRPLLITTNLSNKSGNLLFAQR